MHEKAIENSVANVDDVDKVLPRTTWEWLLLFFIVGLVTVSNIPGWSRLMVLCGLLVSWMFLIYFLHLRLKLQPEIIIYLAWIAWSIIGAIKVQDLSYYLGQLQTLTQMLGLIFVVAGITALRRNLSTVMLAVAIGGIIVALYSYYHGEFQIGSQIEQSERATGLTGNPNLFSYHVLFVIIASCYFWGLKSSLLSRACLMVVVVLSVLMNIASGSRTGYIAAMAFLILWFLFCHSKRLFKKPLLTLSAVFILAWGLHYSADYVMSNTLLGERFQYRHLERGSSLRLQFYIDGFHMIRYNPILGVGLNNYRAHTGLFYSHSDYIEVAANTGVVGFVLYFSIYVVLWRRLNRIRRRTTCAQLLYIIGVLKAAITTILLWNFSTVNITSKLTWLFLAGAIGYSWSIEHKLLSRRENLTN